VSVTDCGRHFRARLHHVDERVDLLGVRGQVVHVEGDPGQLRQGRPTSERWDERELRKSRFFGRLCFAPTVARWQDRSHFRLQTDLAGCLVRSAVPLATGGVERAAVE
jgi:hypothetical protein